MVSQTADRGMLWGLTELSKIIKLFISTRCFSKSARWNVDALGGCVVTKFENTCVNETASNPKAPVILNS
jgi:hypothetical protein